MSRYPLARQGVFHTIQGEGALLGLPMVFVRLAGCSVGCPLCDTDYRKVETVSVTEIVERANAVRQPATSWVWITGGEPADHDLFTLVDQLRCHFRVAVATAGHKPLGGARMNFLSVSPHDPAKWVLRWGSELKFVPGVNGFGLEAFTATIEKDPGRWDHRFVSPCEGKPETVAECVAWVGRHADWRMTPQAHKQWALP